ncbi:zinc-ribbon domain containing protein [Neorhodopirellula lusitana]|uniref:zinc-ribbon domain containing protein n=1 Tax=Neorhodopirellula lusitana TaxID=445327 RepID=UPI0038506AB0
MTRRRQKRDIANGRLPPGAVAADCSKQVLGSSFASWRSFYVDVEFSCKDCGRLQVWSARDQKWFYEVAKGSLLATAVRCRECRNRLRDRKELQRQQMKAAEGRRRNPAGS